MQRCSLSTCMPARTWRTPSSICRASSGSNPPAVKCDRHQQSRLEIREAELKGCVLKKINVATGGAFLPLPLLSPSLVCSVSAEHVIHIKEKMEGKERSASAPLETCSHLKQSSDQRRHSEIAEPGPCMTPRHSNNACLQASHHVSRNQMPPPPPKFPYLPSSRSSKFRLSRPAGRLHCGLPSR